MSSAAQGTQSAPYWGAGARCQAGTKKFRGGTLCKLYDFLATIHLKLTQNDIECKL